MTHLQLFPNDLNDQFVNPLWIVDGFLIVFTQIGSSVAPASRSGAVQLKAVVHSGCCSSIVVTRLSEGWVANKLTDIWDF